MKKSLCFMLCLLIFCGSSCSDVKEHPLSYIYEDFSTPYVFNEEITSENVSVDNVTSANELITQELDIHDFVQTYVFPSSLYFSAFANLNDVSLNCGVECLRKTQAGALYSVHRVKQGGWLYVFYQTHNPDLLRSEINHWFYVTEWLSFEDFSSLEKGKSTIEDAIAICDSLQIAKNIYVSSKEDSWWKIDGNQVFYKIYLKDGISTLTFDIQGDSLIFMDIVHDSNFDLMDVSLSLSYPYDARLLDGDFL